MPEASLGVVGTKKSVHEARRPPFGESVRLEKRFKLTQALELQQRVAVQQQPDSNHGRGDVLRSIGSDCKIADARSPRQSAILRGRLAIAALVWRFATAHAGAAA